MRRTWLPLVALAALVVSCADSEEAVEEPSPASGTEGADEGGASPEAPPETEAEEGAEEEVVEAPVDWGDASPALREAFRVRSSSLVLDDGEKLPRVIEHVGTGLVFVYVRGGRFLLGSEPGEEGRYEDEGPARWVRMSGFYLSGTEVTYAAWRAGGGREIAGIEETHPVAGIDWFAARDWCRSNGFSLPSEARWEYASSGRSNDDFPWGMVPDRRMCNAQGTSKRDLWTETSPAAAISTDCSWCGAYDMGGNVMEWCLDAWVPDYESIAEGARDPLRPAEGEAPEVERVVRGGSYYSDSADQIRAAYRNSIAPGDVGANLGFRAVVER